MSTSEGATPALAGWTAAHSIVLPAWSDTRAQPPADVRDGIAELVASYSYFYDGRALEQLVQLFAPDAVVINPRGTYEGRDAIRRNYDYNISRRRRSLHFVTNTVIAQPESGPIACVSYWYSTSEYNDGTARGTGGLYIDRVVRNEARRWTFAERRITHNISHQLNLPPSAAPESFPTPTSPLTSTA